MHPPRWLEDAAGAPTPLKPGTVPALQGFVGESSVGVLLAKDVVLDIDTGCERLTHLGHGPLE